MILQYRVIDNKFYNLKEILKVHFQLSDNLITKLKQNRKILLNSEFTYLDHLVKINDFVEIDLDLEEFSENIVPNPNIKLDIVFEDDSILIVNKSAGIPVHPSMNHFTDSLSNAVKYYFNTINLKKKIRPVNRLDKNTSGLVVFAKNEYVQELLIKQMKANIFKKEYLAILVGTLKEKNGVINAPIARKEGSIIEREINEKGFSSITHFKLIRNFEYNNTKLSLVKFVLETGRTHQIRLHSKYINHPILGDSLYGSSSLFISRQALHAYKINFLHPIKKEPLSFEVPLPEDLLLILN